MTGNDDGIDGDVELATTKQDEEDDGTPLSL